MSRLVVLTGAGMSAESGISTFRDSGGLWDRYPVEQVATPEGYAANPQLVLDFYNQRRRELLSVRPNRGHVLLAELERQVAECVAAQDRCGSDYVRLQELQAQQAELEEKLEEKTERWVYLTELKEKIDAQGI